MRIGEVARAAGVNVETLRYYERRGLLGPPERTPHGYRVYDAETVRLLRSIKDAQGLGFSLAEIEEYLRLTAAGQAAADAVRVRIASKIDEVDAKIANLQHMRARLMRTLDTLHVTNGDSAGGTLRQTSLEGFVVAWRDMLPEGPLARVPAAELRRLRARFLAGAGWGELGAIEAELQQRDEALADALAAGHHIVLWFEQDVLDQLQLLQVLAAVGDAPRVELIVFDHPDHKGLGELEPAALEALWPERVALTPEIAALAARAWDAVCAPDPTAIASLLASDTSALPLLAPALARWLQELPDAAGGLALSERRILESLADAPRTRFELFLESMDGERLLLNGDTWFFRRLEELGGLVEGDDRLAITDAGRRVLAGELDRVEQVGLDRWLGGTHLTTENAWRRDGERLVAP